MKKHAGVLLCILLMAVLTVAFFTAFITSIREETEIIIETTAEETSIEETTTEETTQAQKAVTAAKPTKTSTKPKTTTETKAPTYKPTTEQQKPKTYTEQDLYWLSRIIHAESNGEPMLGKLAVGTVIMNRVKSPEFPNTVKGVIFDTKHGVQFTPVANNSIYNTPSSESVEAAKKVLEGYRISDKVLYFVNENISPNSWIAQNRDYVLTVGNHKFYA